MTIPNTDRKIASDWAREMLALPPGKALILDNNACYNHGVSEQEVRHVQRRNGNAPLSPPVARRGA